MSANLIPLQIDQTTGNLVAKQITGVYTPPTGTGFQYVTNGSPNLSAVTPTAATALLKLFSSSLQGLVPPSGGGTSNFLRADGSWAVPSTSNVVTSFNTRTGAVTLTNADVLTAIGYTPYNASNPSGYLSTAVQSLTAGTGVSVTAPTGSVTITNTGVTAFNTRTGSVTLSSSDVTTALGFTPYNATNPSGYISSNQTITITGDISGSGTTAITATLPSITTAGTYGLVTVNAKGQVTSGTSPTTLAGYGITDGVSSQVSTTMGNGVSLTFQGGGTVHGVPTPTTGTDAANKNYVDSVAQGLTWKVAVKAATTTNLAAAYVGSPTFTLTASPPTTLPTFDTYSPGVGDRLLVKDQTTQSQNGIYVVTQTTDPWILTRASDFNEVSPIDEVNGAAVFVEEGSTYGNTTWTQVDTVTTFDTDPIAWSLMASGGGGTVTSVSVTGANGIGVTGSPVTTTGTIALSLGAITPSSVAATGSVTGSNLSGTNTGDQTITLTGDATGSGTASIAVTLAASGVTAGSYTYPAITVNSKGLVTGASSGVTPVTSVSGTSGNITSTGGTTPTLNLATTAVTAGSYNTANITVDSFGRVTAASNGVAGSVTSVTVTGANGIGVTGSPITSSGTIALSLGAITPTSINASGTIVGSNIAAGATVSGTNTGDQTVTSTGGTITVTTPTSSTINIDLPATTVTAGSYTNTNLTVDAYGRITAASNGTAGTVTSVALADGSTTPIYTISGSPVTSSGTLTFTLNSQTANYVFAAPDGSAGQPGFRALVAADIPALSYVTSVSVTAGTGITASVATATTTPDISIAANSAMGTGGAGIERVVWATNTSGEFASTTPSSVTSGVTVSSVTATTSTATYAFTGYDHPPVAVEVYGFNTTTISWVMNSISGTGQAVTVADTGTATTPNMITSFTSSNTLTFAMPATAAGATATAASYIILMFRF